MRGKPMEGWLRVEPAGVTTDKGLKPWVDLSVKFARSLPPKHKAKKPTAKKPVANKRVGGSKPATPPKAAARR